MGADFSVDFPHTLIPGWWWAVWFGVIIPVSKCQGTFSRELNRGAYTGTEEPENQMGTQWIPERREQRGEVRVTDSWETREGCRDGP